MGTSNISQGTSAGGRAIASGPNRQWKPNIHHPSHPQRWILLWLGVIITVAQLKTGKFR